MAIVHVRSSGTAVHQPLVDIPPLCKTHTSPKTASRRQQLRLNQTPTSLKDFSEDSRKRMQSSFRSLQDIIPVLNAVWSMNTEGQGSIGRPLPNNPGIPFALWIAVRDTHDFRAHW